MYFQIYIVYLPIKSFHGILTIKRIYVLICDVIITNYFKMSSVDLDFDELDQIIDMQSLYKYMFGEVEVDTIVEEPIADAELDQITDMQSLYNYMFGEEAAVEENIIEGIPNTWLDELLNVEIYEEERPKECEENIIERMPNTWLDVE